MKEPNRTPIVDLALVALGCLVVGCVAGLLLLFPVLVAGAIEPEGWLMGAFGFGAVGIIISPIVERQMRGGL
jgi:hypothetical protein